MEAKTGDITPHTSQIISVNHKDTSRLLEVYVTRSLSLNDRTLVVSQKRNRKKNKWVTLPHQQRIRRHSSDPSVLLDPSSNDENITSINFSPTTVPVFQPVMDLADHDNVSKEKERKKDKKKKKKKEQKNSLWKGFLNLFSKTTEEIEEKDFKPAMDDKKSSHEPTSPQAQCLPSASAIQKRKSLKRRFSKKKLSLKRSMKDHPDKDSAKGPVDTIPSIHVDVSGIESVLSVEPTYTYYEKVSEEMEKIVHEVKDKEVLTDEQVIQRLAALMREQGDAIAEKLNENPTLSAFFQKLSYSSFQQMADTYLEREAPDLRKSSKTTVPPTAPELVKLAFTLDFTARIAGLSRQNAGHIMGLGNRYLEDRFIYIQASSDHPLSDNED